MSDSMTNATTGAVDDVLAPTTNLLVSSSSSPGSTSALQIGTITALILSRIAPSITLTSKKAFRKVSSRVPGPVVRNCDKLCRLLKA
ncbi:hypothetical protein D3C87_1681180 [compost metagenome]